MGADEDETVGTACSSSFSLSPATPVYSKADSKSAMTANTPKERPPMEFFKVPSVPPKASPKVFHPKFVTTQWLHALSTHVLRMESPQDDAATWLGFWALFTVTCANYVLTPMRDAIALTLGVEHMPKLTLASTLLAFCSSVPIGWLFEAPDPERRKLFKKMGMTRGETQGTSLALFYRFFGGLLLTYAVGFTWITTLAQTQEQNQEPTIVVFGWAFVSSWQWVWNRLSKVIYIAFFLVVHLMKLHSLSLVWGVTTEAMEYEEVARRNSQRQHLLAQTTTAPSRFRRLNLVGQTRLKRLSLIGFGGTLGGILGSFIASSLAHVLLLSGLLVVAFLLLETAAQLSIELGRIMQIHWEEQQENLFKSSDNLKSLDSSMKRSVSLGSMKRVASGNSLHRVVSNQELQSSSSSQMRSNSPTTIGEDDELNDDNTFFQRLMRGVKTILRSRLLMAIFTYNALYASTNVLLSFQRAALVANRNANTNTEADTAFLANINMASSVAVFFLQATGLGAFVAATCGPRWTLSLMPLIRLGGILTLAWWHRFTDGQPPNLILFLVLDECTRVMNMAVAKPVRESLWRGLSNEARYEAKPIVDTLANRWGGGSAAFLVFTIHKVLDWFGEAHPETGVRTLFGFPPVLFLCMIVAVWWTMVSADLGHIRARIDMELKKHQ